MMDINWDLSPEGAVAIKQDSWGNLYWVNKQDKYWGKSEWSRLLHHSSWQTIATRPTEKTAADDKQEGEKWTHTYKGVVCRIEYERNGCAWIVNESGEDFLIDTRALKPIKPKLTKAQAWDMLTKIDGRAEFKTVMNTVMAMLEKYDITD